MDWRSTRAEQRQTEQQRFGDALNAALADAGMTQSELARAYAEAMGGSVTQSKVSGWRYGDSLPEKGDPAAVFLIERLVKVPPGSLSRHLGYLPVDTDGCTVEAAVVSDPYLHEPDRVGLIAQYRALAAFRRR